MMHGLQKSVDEKLKCFGKLFFVPILFIVDFLPLVQDVYVHLKSL